jgi:multidrug transporter EmrE-like cation transporter
MASSVTTIPPKAAGRSNKSIYMVLGCTVFAAAAQVLLKFGATHAMPSMNPADPSTWMPFATALLGNYQLVLGYCAHSANALLLILALRDGQLSMLYPIIALTYVWVNLLSIYFFHEPMNVWKAVGIVLVIGGVTLMGRASARE